MLINIVKPNFGCHLNNAAKPFLIWAFSIKKPYSSTEHVVNTREAKVFAEEDFSDAKPVELDEVRSETKTKSSIYVPHPDVLSRPEEEIEKFRKEHDIKIHGKNIPRPILSFNEANFPSYISDIIRKNAFEKPTPIQSESWPIALSGYDMVGIARTGSGKTLGYLLPAIIRKNELQTKKADNPSILVLAPTRELAIQIDVVAKIFRQHVSSVCVYGGSPRPRQEMLLNQKPDICIATPGRLLDFVRQGVVTLENCSYIVMDEADRMLDMGFEPQIREVMDHTSDDKQVLMWSATWPKEIRSLAEDFLKDYIRITVGSEELTANPNIDQRIEFCTFYEKEDSLLNFLNSQPKGKTLIFTETKRMADQLEHALNRKRFKCKALHGDKSQTAREFILNGFRSNSFQILIATDVAARGLDIDDINYVINYEMPKTIDSYIHRIGRTARHEKKGISYSLVTDEDMPIAKDLVEVLREANQEVPPELLEMAKSSVRINIRERYAPRTGRDSFRRNPFQRNNYNQSFSGRNSYDRRKDYNRRDNFRRDDRMDDEDFHDFDNSRKSRDQRPNRNKQDEDFW